MIKPFHKPNSFLKTFVAIFFLITNTVNQADEMEKVMPNNQYSLWQIISEIEKKMPISVDEIESVLGYPLKEKNRDENFAYFSGRGHPLNKDISISEVSLMIRPSLIFDEKSALAIEIAGQCVTLEEIHQRFSELTLMQAPRGRSLQETTVWSSFRDWGSISFAFKEESPECLFRVSFRRSIKK